MSSDADGCGCLLLILGLGAAVLGLGYAVYDGYVYRELPESAQKEVSARASLKNGEKKEVYTKDIRAHLSITVNNGSEWSIRGATASATIRFPDGSVITTSGEVVNWWGGSAELNIAPKEQGRWCVLRFPEELNQVIQAYGYEKFTWRLESINGRRRPIKLVKKPIEWTKGLFERESEPAK